ncbi:phospholipase D family protein [Allofranklinella schreckenbergeri]|uniref:Phospholipase D family protein n=1 Tax=Allofranklinella schreckenbergeri TaxID=1076744 RepID=A0A3M6QJY2_9BURK|nr:phospholipase D family protein [Allofranklinella schreckenbergeri]RMX02819.1 phospholipase D family protein [Allofranklinella schreckenbergeri]
MLKKSILFVLIAAALVVALALLTRQALPDNSQRPPSQRLPIQPEGQFARHLLPRMAERPGLSGIYPLREGRDAFLARLALAESAQYTLDVQYYIWHDDISGRLLLQSLYKAAERGVRVRLLLDDNNTSGMDGLLAAVNAHPRIEVRLFNPFMQRGFRPLGYLSDFFRLNRRMHNKSFTADGLVTIVGGRNVGDEYFGAGTGVMFADLDVAAIGPAALAVEQDFDRYWASESAYPAENIIDPAAPAAFDTTPAANAQTRAYLHALSQSAFARHLQAGTLPLEWAQATLVSDDPAKGLGQALPDNTVLAHIGPVLAAAQNELLIVSPYFVPTQRGTDLLGQVARSGKKVTVLTNSLSATDVAPVHAGYAKYRKDLLQAGVQLLELKPDATVIAESHGGLTGSSGASLHAKTFAVDRQKLFVGSFNMDPRSAQLNTEMGFILHSPELAGQLADGLTRHAAHHTYSVAQTPRGDLQWQTQEGGKTVAYDSEPQSGWLQRFAVWFCGLLPIEWLL